MTLRPERLSLALLGVLLIGAPQLYGGVFPWTIVAITGVALTVLLSTLWATRVAPGLGTPWVAWAIGGAAVWTLLQALPLPCGLVSWVAPKSASELRAGLDLLDSPQPAWCSLSRDPGATRLEVLKGAAIGATFVSAWLLSAHASRSAVIWLCAISTLAMSIVAHLHMALGMEEVFGVYRPLYAGTSLQLAPLMNPNNLGAFAALGVPLWLGILLRAREPRSRALAGLAIVLTAATALLSLSRGAIAMLFGCTALMLFFSLRRKHGSRRSGSRARWLSRAGVGLSLSLGVGFSAYLAADQVLIQFEQDTAGKLGLIGRALGFAAQHSWIGVGRGAFASTFVAGGDSNYYAHAENFFVQWASDWGFPVALLLLGSLGYALWRALRDARSLRTLGAIVGVVGLASQNLVDLGLELAGVAVVAAALLGAAVAPSTRTQMRRSEAIRIPIDRFSLAVAAFATAAFVWLGPNAERDSTAGLETGLRARIEAEDRSGFRALLRRAVRLHPSEPVFAVLAAGEALAHGDRHALRWINRGMQLAPGWTAPHVQAFQWLWRERRYGQALLEMRAAAEIRPSALRQYVCVVAQQGSEPVLRAAPRKRDEQRAAFLEAASSCHRLEHEVARDLDAVLRREFPERPAARERQATRLARRGELDAALAELDTLRQSDPAREQGRTLRVELLFEGKRFAEAAQNALELAPSTQPREAARLWELRARALAEIGDDAGWTSAIDALRRTVSSDVRQLARSYALEGELHRRRGRAGAALRAYREAYRIKNDAGYLATYAGISKELGDQAAALWAYMRLCELEPNHPSYCTQRDHIVEQTRLNFGAKVRN